MARTEWLFVLAAAAIACGACSDTGARSRGGPADGSVVAETCEAGRCVVTLAAAPAPANLVAASGHVFFTSCDGTRGSVLAVPNGGGDVVTLATGACPTGLALAGSSLYASGLDDAAILAIPADGGAPRRFLSVGEPVERLAADPDAVYFATRTALSSAPLGGGPLAQLTGSHAWTNLVASGGRVFFGDRTQNQILAVPTTGGAESVVAAGADGVSAIALDDESVYAATGYTVTKVPRSGGALTTIGTAAGDEVLSIAADPGGVYVTSEAVVWSLSKVGGAEIALASGQKTARGVVTDAASLYFANTRACCGAISKITPK